MVLSRVDQQTQCHDWYGCMSTLPHVAHCMYVLPPIWSVYNTSLPVLWSSGTCGGHTLTVHWSHHMHGTHSLPLETLLDPTVRLSQCVYLYASYNRWSKTTSVYCPEPMSALKPREGASNYHTLFGPILCRIWRLQNVPYKVAACSHLLC